MASKMEKEILKYLTEINDKVSDVDKKVAVIEEHLRNLNGKVAKHELEISGIKNKISYWAGGIATGVTIISVLISKFF